MIHKSKSVSVSVSVTTLAAASIITALNLVATPAPAAEPTPVVISYEPGNGAVARFTDPLAANGTVGSSRVDLQACKLEYSIVSPK